MCLLLPAGLPCACYCLQGYPVPVYDPCACYCLQGYRVHIHMQKCWGADKLAAPTLSYWCFIPGMAFRNLKALNLR